MANRESCTVKAGEWTYLFVNSTLTHKINVMRFKEDKDGAAEPPEVVGPIVVNQKRELSKGGSIAAVYLEVRDEIHLFYIGIGTTTPTTLVEAVLAKASKATKDQINKAWITNGMALNSKALTPDARSMLSSNLDARMSPRVFYNPAGRLNNVARAAYVPSKNNWNVTMLPSITS
jgi:hypothetical protein